jgi:hypothetical protein
MQDVTYIGRPYTQDSHAFNTLQFADASIYEPEVLSSELSAIRHSACRSNTVLISDENLSGWPFYNFINRELIAERLSNEIPDAEVILFLRNQTDLILSLYNHFVKIGWFDGVLDESFVSSPGEGARLDQWLDGTLNWNPKRRYISHLAKVNIEHFRYSRLLAMYRRHFSRVHVYLYEDFRLRPESIVQELAELMSTRMSLPVGKQGENESLTGRELHRQMIENRLSSLVRRVNSTPVKALVKVLASLIPDEIDRNTEYVKSLIQLADLASDNKLVESDWCCGLSRHPEAYFR